MDSGKCIQKNHARETDGKKIDCERVFLRSVLFLLFALASFLILLFAPVLLFGDQSISLQADLRMCDLWHALFAGGEYNFEHPQYGILMVKIPFIAIFVFMCIAIIDAFGVVLGVLSLSGKLAADHKILIVYQGISCLLQCIVFIVIIQLRAETINISGEKQQFYRVFSVSASFLVSVLCSLFSLCAAWKIKKNNVEGIKKNWLMYLFLFVPALLVIVYNIYPMLLSLCLSMKEYVIADGIWGSKWIGLCNYKRIFTDSDMLYVVGNTVFISVLRMIISIVPPIILAIMLYEMSLKKMRKIVQTVIYIPHFFSWVVVYAIAYSFINPDGLFNNVSGGEVHILANEKAFIPLLLITDLWKECGWNTILYMAALSNVDPALNEAAAIDGAGPLKRLRAITIPCIKPIIVFTIVMAVGNLLKGAGYEQIMLFGSDIMHTAQVIDTWVIWKGLQDLQYGLGSAVSFFQALIGMVMVVSCNRLSEKWAGVGLY